MWRYVCCSYLRLLYTLTVLACYSLAKHTLGIRWLLEIKYFMLPLIVYCFFNQQALDYSVSCVEAIDLVHSIVKKKVTLYRIGWIIIPNWYYPHCKSVKNIILYRSKRYLMVWVDFLRYDNYIISVTTNHAIVTVTTRHFEFLPMS